MSNSIKVIGVIYQEPAFSHECCGEKFYNTVIECKRKSDVSDFLPVIVSENLVKICEMGKRIQVDGDLRSYNLHLSETKSKLVLNIFANDIYETDLDDNNTISLDGYLCKTPIYRQTPLGREISDILLATNRISGKSDYIPCIAWGRNAKCLAKSTVGDYVCIKGRMQSRDYDKKIKDTIEKHTAYEVSIINLIQ